MRWPFPDSIMRGKYPKQGGLTPMRSRPLPVTVAAILLALFSVLWDLSFLLWTQAVPREEEIPVFIVFLTVVVGVAGLVGAAGLWMLKKWGSGSPSLFLYLTSWTERRG